MNVMFEKSSQDENQKTQAIFFVWSKNYFWKQKKLKVKTFSACDYIYNQASQLDMRNQCIFIGISVSKFSLVLHFTVKLLFGSLRPLIYTRDLQHILCQFFEKQSATKYFR